MPPEDRRASCNARLRVVDGDDEDSLRMPQRSKQLLDGDEARVD